MIRRTLSIPVLAMTVAGVVTAAAGFHLVRGWQLSRLAQIFLDRAAEAESGEQWLTAADLFDRYLRLVPENGKVRRDLAVTYAKGARTLPEKQRAAALHYRALASASEQEADELRSALADLLLQTGRLLEAESEAQQVLAELPDDPQANRVLALSRYLQWRDGALGSKTPKELQLLGGFELALELNPGDIALAEIAATLYREYPAITEAHIPNMTPEHRARSADALLDRAVEKNPKNPEAWLARHLYRLKYVRRDPANTDVEQEDLKRAADDVAKALELGPQHPKVLLVASEELYCQVRDARAQPSEKPMPVDAVSDCEELLKRLINGRLAMDNPLPHLRLGDLYALENDLDGAINVWQEGLPAFARPTVRATFHARIADHLLKAGRPTEAQPPLASIESILTELGGTIRREDHLRLMQAQGLRQATYYLQVGRYAEAIGELQRAIARQPQLQPDLQTSYIAWELLGRSFSGLQDWTAAATTFDRAANFLPAETSARLAAAEAWLSAGRTELAIDRASQIIDQAAQANAEQDGGAAQVGAPAQANAPAQKQKQKLVPNLPAAWLVLATAELQSQAARLPADRHWEPLQRALAALDKIPSGSLSAPWRVDFLHADYLALKSAEDATTDSEQAAAAEVLRQAESKYQSRPEFWFQACLAYERLAQPQDAQRAWQHLNQLPGAQTEAAIAASRRAAAHDDYSQATSILENAAGSLPPAAQERLRQELIRLAQAKQDLRQMEALFRGTLRQRPHDVSALCGLAELALRAGDLKTLEQWERQLAVAGPPGDVWSQYFRISRLCTSATGPRDGRLVEALSEQSRLATIRPNWADAFSLRGAIEQRLENDKAAAAAYEQAVQLGERRYAIFEQLIACLDRLHRTEDVEKYLTRMQSYLPSSQRLTELASARQLDENRPEQAIEIAQRALARRPGDINAQLWLGRLLLVTDRLPEAQTTFAKASQAAPTDARTWHGLFIAHLRSGDQEQARRALESLRKNAQLKPEALARVLGAAYAQLGDKTQALELLTQAVELNPSSAPGHLQLAQMLAETDRDRAKFHLQQALDLDPNLTQARWLLATLLAASGTEEDLAAAERLLDQAGAEATIDDRRVRAILLAQHFGDNGLGRAITILEQVVAGGKESTTDRLLLAQFLERRAAATTDSAAAEKLVASAGEQLLHIATRERATPSDVGVLINFLLRHDQKKEAAQWLDRLEQRLQAQAKADPKAIALLIDLRLQQGAVQRVEPWLVKLEAADRDPFRPLIARVKYFAALPKVELIGPAIETKVDLLIAAAKSLKEQSRIARQAGDLYLLVNQLAGAEKWYRIVLTSDPEQFPLLATALVRQGRAREAIRLCEAAAETDTTSRPAITLTSLLLETGAKAEYMSLAEPMLAAALEKFKDDATLLYGVGMLRVLEDRYSDAMGLLKQVIKLNPRHVPALNNLAMLLAETEETRKEGLALVERAIAHRGHQPTLLDTKGTILLWSGQTQDAVTFLEAAARGSATDPRHSFHLALAYRELGATGHAHEQLAAALERQLERQILTPTDRKALSRLQASLAPAAGAAKPEER